MNALDLAKFIDEDADMGADEYFIAASMLRRQHEAIKVLREALCMAKLHFVVGGCMYDKAEQALKDTEDLA